MKIWWMVWFLDIRNWKSKTNLNGMNGTQGENIWFVDGNEWGNEKNWQHNLWDGWMNSTWAAGNIFVPFWHTSKCSKSKKGKKMGWEKNPRGGERHKKPPAGETGWKRGNNVFSEQINGEIGWQLNYGISSDDDGERGIWKGNWRTEANKKTMRRKLERRRWRPANVMT